MYKKIILSMALDQGFGPRAIDQAKRLLDKGGEIIAVHVYEPPQGSVKTYLPEDAVANALKSVKKSMAERLKDTPEIKPVLLEGHSGLTITNYAKQIGADCIIVGSHKPGLADYFLGSTAARVVRHAPCSVLVLR